MRHVIAWKTFNFSFRFVMKNGNFLLIFRFSDFLIFHAHNCLDHDVIYLCAQPTRNDETYFSRRNFPSAFYDIHLVFSQAFHRWSWNLFDTDDSMMNVVDDVAHDEFSL